MRRLLLTALAIALLTAGGLLWAQDDVFPTPTLVCPNTQVGRLILNERGRVALRGSGPLNVRAGPGTTSDILGQIADGGVFYVLEGPACTPRYAWYRVIHRRGDGRTLTGWIAEGDRDSYFVERYPPGS
ncbi:MAG: SH3 domain-containing protein [Aggregatilineales bacterium]